MRKKNNKLTGGSTFEKPDWEFSAPITNPLPILKMIPRTPDGDRAFISVLEGFHKNDDKLERFVIEEANHRPGIYEDINRWVLRHYRDR